MAEDYKKNSITLPGAVAIGTGVMIGAGIFALIEQIAELAGPLFPLSFVVGAGVTAFSAYTPTSRCRTRFSPAIPQARAITVTIEKRLELPVLDIRRATALARSMVARWGMDPEIGPVDLRESEDHPFLGQQIAQPQTFADETAARVDQAVMTLLHAAEKQATLREDAQGRQNS